MEEQITALAPSSAGRTEAPSARPWLLFALLGLVGLAALALRLHHLHRYVIRSDEGVYLESLMLMERGYLPFRDFFSSQGPLFLPILFPFSLLGGVLGPRLGVALFAILGLLAVAALGRRLGGGIGAIVALLLAALSPNLLYVSRLTLAEAPSAGLAAVAVWISTRAPSRIWLCVAAMLLAVALLIKPLAAPAGFAMLALAIDARAPQRQWRALGIDLGLMLAAAALVVLLASVPFGIAAVRDQFIDFHIEVTRVEQRGRAVGGWDNVAVALPELLDEGAGLYLMAAAGLLVALISRRALALGVTLWLLGTIAMLWVYVPFYDRFLIFLFPPLALLAATGCASLRLSNRWASLLGPTPAILPAEAPGGFSWRRVLMAFVLVAGLAYLVSLPRVVAQDLIVARSPWEPLRLAEYQAAVDLAAMTAPDEYVVTDNHSIAFMAGRIVPPSLVDLSEARVTIGSIEADEVLQALDEYQVNVVVWWSDDRFGKLGGFERPFRRVFDQAREYDGERSLFVRRGAALREGGLPASDTPE